MLLVLFACPQEKDNHQSRINGRHRYLKLRCQCGIGGLHAEINAGSHAPIPYSLITW